MIHLVFFGGHASVIGDSVRKEKKGGKGERMGLESSERWGE